MDAVWVVWSGVFPVERAGGTLMGLGPGLNGVDDLLGRPSPGGRLLQTGSAQSGVPRTERARDERVRGASGGALGPAGGGGNPVEVSPLAEGVEDRFVCPVPWAPCLRGETGLADSGAPGPE